MLQPSSDIDTKFESLNASSHPPHYAPRDPKSGARSNTFMASASMDWRKKVVVEHLLWQGGVSREIAIGA